MIDIDECEEGNHKCSNFATCINSMNQGYDCECLVGFVGDGMTCRGMYDQDQDNIVTLYMTLCVISVQNHYAVSDAFIIGISSFGVVMVLMMCFLNMVIAGRIKVKRYCDHHNIK